MSRADGSSPRNFATATCIFSRPPIRGSILLGAAGFLFALGGIWLRGRERIEDEVLITPEISAAASAIYWVRRELFGETS
mgnify:CR=1 FL=1